MNQVNAFTGIGGTNVPAGTAAIVFNDNGAFSSGSTTTGNGTIAGNTKRARVFLMLHELAHSMGAAGFMSDRGNDTAGKLNNDLIFKNCQGMLEWGK